MSEQEFKNTKRVIVDPEDEKHMFFITQVYDECVKNKPHLIEIPDITFGMYKWYRVLWRKIKRVWVRVKRFFGWRPPIETIITTQDGRKIHFDGDANAYFKDAKEILVNKEGERYAVYRTRIKKRTVR